MILQVPAQVQVLYRSDLCIVFFCFLVCELCCVGVAFPARYPFVPFVIPLGGLAQGNEGLCYPPWSDATSPHRGSCRFVQVLL